jgi:hypothetical protein
MQILPLSASILRLTKCLPMVAGPELPELLAVELLEVLAVEVAEEVPVAQSSDCDQVLVLNCLKCWLWRWLWRWRWRIPSVPVAALYSNQFVPAQNYANELSVGCADLLNALQGLARTSPGTLRVQIVLTIIGLGHGAATAAAKLSRSRVVVGYVHIGLLHQQRVQLIGREVKTVGRPLAHCGERVAPIVDVNVAGRSEVVLRLQAVWVEAMAKPL